MSYSGTMTGREYSSNTGARNRMAGRLLYWAEEVFVFILIFQFSTALVALILTDPSDLESKSSLARNLWYPGYLLVLFLGFGYYQSWYVWPCLTRF